MKKRRKRNSPGGGQPQNPVSKGEFNTPFANLGNLLKQFQTKKQAESGGNRSETKNRRYDNATVQRIPKNRLRSDNDLFREAMAGVEPLEGNRLQPRQPGPLSKPSRRPHLEGELEA